MLLFNLSIENMNLKIYPTLEILQAPEKQQGRDWANISAVMEMIFWRRETDKTHEKYKTCKIYGMLDRVVLRKKVRKEMGKKVLGRVYKMWMVLTIIFEV